MEVTFLRDVNMEALPNGIFDAFCKVEPRFGNFDWGVVFPIAGYNALYRLYDKDELYIQFDDEDDLPFPSVADEPYFSRLVNCYSQGFYDGYAAAGEFVKVALIDRLAEETLIHRVYSGVLRMETKVVDFPIRYEENRSIAYAGDFYRFGKTVGSFVKCWDTILNNVPAFESKFTVDNRTERPVRKLKLNISQTESVELFNGLEAINAIEGATKKERLQNFMAVFNVEIKNPYQTANNMKNRNNGSEMLFFDKIVAALKSSMDE